MGGISSDSAYSMPYQSCFFLDCLGLCNQFFGGGKMRELFSAGFENMGWLDSTMLVFPTVVTISEIWKWGGVGLIGFLGSLHLLTPIIRLPRSCNWGKAPPIALRLRRWFAELCFSYLQFFLISLHSSSTVVHYVFPGKLSPDFQCKLILLMLPKLNFFSSNIKIG